MRNDIGRIDIDGDRDFPVMGVALVLIGQGLIWGVIGFAIGWALS